MGWASIGMRLALIVALCLSHLTREDVNAADPSHNHLEWDYIGGDAENEIDAHLTEEDFNRNNVDKASALAKRILEHLYEQHHEKALFELWRRLKKVGLSQDEQELGTDIISAFETEDELRRFMIKYITDEMSHQTIALGVNWRLKTVVIAGNVKTFNFWHSTPLFIHDKETGEKRLKAIHPFIKDVGFQPSDLDAIKDIVAPEYPNYEVVIVEPSNGDLWDAVQDIRVVGKGRRPGELRQEVAAQAFDAQMQIRAYFESKGGGSNPEDTFIQTSIPYCVSCWENLIKKSNIEVLEDIDEGNKTANKWSKPKKLKIRYSGVPSQVQAEEKLVRTENTPRYIKKLVQESGGVCRKLCLKFKDFIEIDADKFASTIQGLSEQNKRRLFYALDKIGMTKLTGSDEAVNEIQEQWSIWKITCAHQVLQDLKNKTIIAALFSFGNESLDYEKTFISPAILSESWNYYQAKELEEIAEKYEKFKDDEIAAHVGKDISMMWKVVRTSIGVSTFVKGLIEESPESLVILGGAFKKNRILSPFCRIVKFKWGQLKATGLKIFDKLRYFGRFAGNPLIAFNIYSFVSNLKDLSKLKDFCNRNDSLFQERLQIDCSYDIHIQTANTIATGVGIFTGVATGIVDALALVGILTGPVGLVILAIDALLIIGLQIFTAVELVGKIESSLVGGLHSDEKLWSGIRSFLGLSAPQSIEHLMELKNSYDYDVIVADGILKELENIQSYISPTTHTRNHIEVNCTEKNRWTPSPKKRIRLMLEIFWPAAFVVDASIPEKNKVCAIIQEYEEDSEADFQTKQSVHQFRVEPDQPNGRQLECKPNSLADRAYSNDPEYVGGPLNGILCHNVIAVSAIDRPDSPVIVDLKNGTDTLLGFPHRKHWFVVQDGLKKFTGGSSDDIFLMTNISLKGQLDGAGGTNTLILNYVGSPDVTYDLRKPKVNSKSNNDLDLTLNNVQQIVGREGKTDRVVTACNTAYVRLQGGESASNPDEITVPPNLDCDHFNTVFHIRQFTTLVNNHTGGGNFTYVVELGPNIQVLLQKEHRNNAVHQFVFSEDSVNADISFENGVFLIKNKTAEFRGTNVDLPSQNFNLMTTAGLSINYDNKTNSFFGVMSVSKRGSAHGLFNFPNRFNISANSYERADIVGGEKDDILIFTGNGSFLGDFDGRDGSDTVVLQPDFMPGQSICFKFDVFQLLYFCNADELGTFTGFSMILKTIANIVGRHGMTEIIHVDCDLKWLDLKGGSANGSDSITVPSDLSCQPKISFVVSNYTKVENGAVEGNFSYQIHVEEAQTSSINVNMTGNAIHNYIFLKNASQLTGVKFNPESNELQIQFNKVSWSGILPLNRSRFFLADKMAVQVWPEVLGFAFVNSTSTVQIKGLQGYPNIVYLATATQDSTVIGGGKNDTFILTSQKFFGQISGGGGKNSMVVADEIWNGQLMIINGITNTLSVKKGPNVTEYQVGFKDIQIFFGRVGQPDIVYPGCNTTLVDTREGSKGSTYDLVHVPAYLDCYLDLDVAIRPNLIVINDATEAGDFTYRGRFRGGNTSIFLTFGHAVDHKVILAMDFLELERLHIDQGRLNMTATDDSQFSLDFFIPIGEQTQTQPSIIAFQDGLHLKISHSGDYSSAVYGVLRNVSSTDMAELTNDIGGSSLIKKYKNTAKATQTTVVMQVMKDTLVSIGSGGRFNVIDSTSGYNTNILVHNDADDTTFRIANDTQDVLILHHSQSNGAKVLDLTAVVNGDHVIRPLLSKQNKDILVTIKDVQITIAGLAEERFEDWKTWQVFLREFYLNIEKHDEKFILVSKPIVIDPEKVDVMVLNTANLEYGTDITTKTIAKLKFPTSKTIAGVHYHAFRQGNSLLLTNLFNRPFERPSTVIFHDFYIKSVALTLDHKRVRFEVTPDHLMLLNMKTPIAKHAPPFEEQLTLLHGFEKESEEIPPRDEL